MSDNFISGREALWGCSKFIFGITLNGQDHYWKRRMGRLKINSIPCFRVSSRIRIKSEETIVKIFRWCNLHLMAKPDKSHDTKLLWMFIRLKKNDDPIRYTFYLPSTAIMIIYHHCRLINFIFLFTKVYDFSAVYLISNDSSNKSRFNL